MTTTTENPAAETGPHSDQADTLRDRLMALPKVGHRTIDAALEGIDIADATPIDELDPAVRDRLEKAPRKRGLVGKALAVWVMTGEGAGPQAQKSQVARQMRESTERGSAQSRRASSRGDAKPEDQRAGELGTEAAAAKGNKLSQRVAAREAAAARAALVAMVKEQRAAGGWPNVTDDATDQFIAENYTANVLGFTSEKAMRGFVDGTTATKDLRDEAKAGAKEITRRIASHQVWARKAVAAAYGVQLEAKEAGRA